MWTSPGELAFLPRCWNTQFAVNRHGGRIRCRSARFEGTAGGVRGGGRIDALEPGSERPAIPPTGVLEAVPNQMDDAGLQRRGRKDGRQRVAHAREPVRDRDQDVVTAARLPIRLQLALTSRALARSLRTLVE